jgi:hypothetical protein
MASVDHWAGAPEEARFATEAMDELLANTTRTREELLDRARELRAKAASADIEGSRSAYEILAKRFEYAAAEQVAST